MKTVDENKARKVLGDDVSTDYPVFKRRNQINEFIGDKVNTLLFKHQNNAEELMEILIFSSDDVMDLRAGNLSLTISDIAKLEMFFGERIIEVPFPVLEEKETLTKEQELTLLIFGMSWIGSNTLDIGRFKININLENCYVYYNTVLLFKGNKHFDMNTGKYNIYGEWLHEGQ